MYTSAGALIGIEYKRKREKWKESSCSAQSFNDLNKKGKTVNQCRHQSLICLSSCLEQWTTRPKGAARLIRILLRSNARRNHVIPALFGSLIKHRGLTPVTRSVLPLSYRFSLWYLLQVIEKLPPHSKTIIADHRTARDPFNYSRYFLWHWFPWSWYRNPWRARVRKECVLAEIQWIQFRHTCSPLSRLTCRLSCMSHLLPISMRSTSADAC